MRIWVGCVASLAVAVRRRRTAVAGSAPAALAITSAAEPVAPGIVSSPYNEIRIAASPDSTYCSGGSPVDCKDPTILYFSGKRPEANTGKLDVYRVRYAMPH